MVAGTALNLQALLRTLIETKYGTQDALARAIGISPSRISRVLKNTYSLSVENCLKLAKETGLPPAEILRAAGKPDIHNLIKDLYGDDAPSRRRDEGLELSDESRHALKNFMEIWAKDPARRKRTKR